MAAALSGVAMATIGGRARANGARPARAGTDRVGAHAGSNRVAAGAMAFMWWHRNGRLLGRLEAPAPGWLAVGFNDRRSLVGTRFVIAAVEPDGTVRAEERVAIGSGHAAVTTLGGVSGLGDLTGAVRGRTTVLDFSLPHRAGDDLAVDLAPGTRTHLMLAYAHAPAFTHHSAWRRHVDLTL